MKLSAVFIRQWWSALARSSHQKGGEFNGRHGQYRPDIDGLRALAVMLVVGYHAFPGWIRGGYIGVDVFFVISGYLISRLIVQRLEAGKFSFTDFYVRRVRRIFPALVLVLAAVAVAGGFLFQPDELGALANSLVASGLFLPNVQIWREIGYFDADANLKPLLHLWSLGVEEQFYLLWPVCLVLLWKIPRYKLTVILLFALASFALNVSLVSPYPAATFYLPFGRFWEFLAGALLVSARMPATPSRVLSSSLSFAGLLTIVLSGLLLTDTHAFPGWLALLPVLGTVAVIGAGPQSWLNLKVLAHALPVFIGLVSYPFYLWHWPLLSIARIEHYGASLSPLLRIVLVLLAFLLAALTYAFVERRVRFHPSRMVVVGLSAAMLIVVVCGYFSFFLVASARARHSTLDVKQLEWKYWENTDCTSRYPWPNKRGWWFCVGNSRQSPTVVVLGDSHANHLFPGLANAFPQHRILNVGTCIPVNGLLPRGDDSGESPCTKTGKAAQEEFIRKIVVSSPGIRYVILSAIWPRFTSGGAEADPMSGHEIDARFDLASGAGGRSQREKFYRGLDDTLAFLEAQNVRPILFLGGVHLPYDIRSCFPRPFVPASQTCVLDSNPQHQARVSFIALVERLKSRHPSLLVFDPLSVFCTANTCQLRAGPTPFFRDGTHLSIAGSDRVARAFAQWTAAHVPDFSSGKKH